MLIGDYAWFCLESNCHGLQSSSQEATLKHVLLLAIRNSNDNNVIKQSHYIWYLNHYISSVIIITIIIMTGYKL